MLSNTKQVKSQRIGTKCIVLVLTKGSKEFVFMYIGLTNRLLEGLFSWFGDNKQRENNKPSVPKERKPTGYLLTKGRAV